jgi:hypothetical protein
MRATPHAAYSIASSTHAPPPPHAPVLAVARLVASRLLPKCEDGRPGSLLARNTKVATAPAIRRSPWRSDTGKCAGSVRRINSRAPAAPTIIASLSGFRELSVAEQI